MSEDVDGLPSGPAVLLLMDEADHPVQLLTTQQLRRLLQSRLITPEQARPRRADLAAVVRGVRWRAVYCPFDGRWWYYRLARVLHPDDYRKRIAFGPAWFLHVDWSQPIPEIGVTERIWFRTGEYIGPWPTHKACLQALDGLRDLFDLCRYPEQLRRAPHGLRCAYAEMGRCDAPCDGSVPLATYFARCRSAWAFATGGAERWEQDAEARMQAAAVAQHFEQAAQMKRQLGFARTWRQQWGPQIRSLHEPGLLLGLRVTRRRAWKLYFFRDGHLSDGPVVPARRAAADIPAWTRSEISREPSDLPDMVRMEQTWLLCHLLLHGERDTALVLPVAGLESAGDLERRLAESLASQGQENGELSTRPKKRSRCAEAG